MQSLALNTEVAFGLYFYKIYELVAAACVIDEFDDENSEVEQLKEGMNTELYNTVQKETYKDVHVNENLTKEQKSRIMKLVADIFSDVPKITHDWAQDKTDYE